MLLAGGIIHKMPHTGGLEAYGGHTRLYSRVSTCSDYVIDAISHGVLREAGVQAQWSMTIW